MKNSNSNKLIAPNPNRQYTYHTDSHNNTYCVSYFAGKPVTACAKLDPRDTYNKEKGEMIAQARCNAKIAKKRVQRAEYRTKMAFEDYLYFKKLWEDKADYMNRAKNTLKQAEKELKQVMKTTK